MTADNAGSLIPDDQPRGLSTRGLKTALQVAARERITADELSLARVTHPCLKTVSDEAVRLATRQPPLWEYRLYFQALADFIAQESAAAASAGPRKSTPAVQPDIQTSLAWIRGKLEEYQGLTGRIDALVNSELQVAFGAPGEPGDIATIVLVASKLGRVYRRFLDLRAEALRKPVSPVFADVLREFSRIGDQSIAEFQTYPVKSLESIETALANDDGETELVLESNSSNTFVAGNLAALSLRSAAFRSRSISSSSTSCRRNARWSALSAAHLQAIFSASANIVGSFNALRWCLSSTALLVSVLLMTSPP